MVKHPRLWLPLAAAALIAAGCAGPVRTVRVFPPDDQLVTVIYPRVNDQSTFLAPADSVIFRAAPDSLFLFGHVVDAGGKLEVNNVAVPIDPDGGWIAWVARGNVLPLPEDSPWHPGTESVVTIHYQTASYEGQEVHRMSRRIHFVSTGPQGPDPSDLVFHPQKMELTVTSDNAKLRCGNPGTYDMFPPRGTVMITDGWQNMAATRGWGDPSKTAADLLTKMWRVTLSGGQVLWIEDSQVSADPRITPIPVTLIDKVKCVVDGRSTRMVLPLAAKVPYRVDRADDERLELTIFGAVSRTDYILQPVESRAVREVHWTQLDSTTYRLTAYLRPEWFWGWQDGFDSAGNLEWTLFQAPEVGKKPLEGLTVVIDPGHGGESLSAIGPTGLTEKDANLMLSRAVDEELKKGGARVKATRVIDVNPSLPERVDYAMQEGADFFVSLHHNALPQGTNPFAHHGASVLYYHEQSFPMAQAVYRAITDGDWQGDGVWYQDVAVARTTFCPSILLEAGFMLHPEEEKLFKDPGHNAYIASMLRIGLEEYLVDLRTKQQQSLESLSVR